MRAALAIAAILLAAPADACDYPGGPPDAEEVRASGEGVVWAYFSNATERYGHAVLGDGIEAGVLRAEVRTSDAVLGPCESSAVLPPERVFEDVTPRIADVTGDGLNDVIAIETEHRSGAALAVYGLNGGGFGKIATTPHIGTAYRWLAVAGVADFDGDGVDDVAYVETPHIGGTLRLWSFAGGEPRQIASAFGFSNHRIGENFNHGGVRDCGAGVELVLPDAGWSRVLLARLSGDRIETETLAPDATPDSLARAMECS